MAQIRWHRTPRRRTRSRGRRSNRGAGGCPRRPTWWQGRGSGRMVNRELVPGSAPAQALRRQTQVRGTLPWWNLCEAGSTEAPRADRYQPSSRTPAGQQASHRLSHLAIQQFGLCTATCTTSAKNSSRIPTKPTTCCGWALPPADRRLPLLRSLAHPGLLPRRHRTRTRPWHSSSPDRPPPCSSRRRDAPRPIRPFGRSSAGGIRYVIDWAAVPCTRSSGSRRSS